MSAPQVPAGRRGSEYAGASETQAHAIGLDIQFVAMGWEQQHADRLLKGQVYANLWTHWVCTTRPELWRDPYDGSGPGGAKGKGENRIIELRNSDSTSPHDLDKADINNVTPSLSC